MRKKIVAGNWKMNTSIDEGINLYDGILKLPVPKDVHILVAVPMTHLGAILSHREKKVTVAAQNCHYEDSGAFTGESSPKVLSEMGVGAVLVGHSERRQYFCEDSEFLAKKVKSILHHGMQVIFCCGEPLNVRQKGDQNEYVSKQISEGLSQIGPEEMSEIVIAYEPIWAIGTGKTASPEQIQEMHGHIRSFLANEYSDNTSQKVSILYGGSVKPTNAKEIFSMKDVDGALVGGASLSLDSFGKIISAIG